MLVLGHKPRNRQDAVRNDLQGLHLAVVVVIKGYRQELLHRRGGALVLQQPVAVLLQLALLRRHRERFLLLVAATDLLGVRFVQNWLLRSGGGYLNYGGTVFWGAGCLFLANLIAYPQNGLPKPFF